MAVTLLDQRLENSNAEVNKLQYTIGAVNDVVNIETHGYRWTSMGYTTAAGGTINWEGSYDGANWTTLNGFVINASSYAAVTFANNTGAWIIDNAGYPFVRFRCSAWTQNFNISIIQDKTSSGPNGGFIPTYTPGTSGLNGEALLICGTDTGNTVRQIKTDSAGYLLVQLGTATTAVTQTDSILYQESITPLGISATLTGTSRYITGTATSTGKASINAFVFTDQAGTFRIEGSMDGATFRKATADTAIVANTPLILSIPFLFVYYRVVIVNGAAAQTALLCTSSVTVA